MHSRGSYALVGAHNALFDVDVRFNALVGQLLSAMGLSTTDLVWDQAAFARDPAGYSRRMQAVQATKEQNKLYPLWANTISPAYQQWQQIYASRGNFDGGAYAQQVDVWTARIADLEKQVRAALANKPAATPAPPVTDIERMLAAARAAASVSQPAPRSSSPRTAAPPSAPAGSPRDRAPLALPPAPFEPPLEPAAKQSWNWKPLAIGGAAVVGLGLLAFATSR